MPLCRRDEGLPNMAHSVDAPVAIVFHSAHHWRRTTDAQRWAI